MIDKAQVIEGDKDLRTFNRECLDQLAIYCRKLFIKLELSESEAKGIVDKFLRERYGI